MNICKNCNKEYKDYKFCPQCGAKLDISDGKNCFNQLNINYKNTYGSWEVTTEGDCEGKSVRNLGTFIGYIDEIALHLADKCFYSLCFHKVPELKDIVYKDKNEEVNVTLDIDSNTWKMNSLDRAKTMKELFKDRPVEIKNGQYYASFIIKRI